MYAKLEYYDESNNLIVEVMEPHQLDKANPWQLAGTFDSVEEADAFIYANSEQARKDDATFTENLNRELLRIGCGGGRALIEQPRARRERKDARTIDLFGTMELFND